MFLVPSAGIMVWTGRSNSPCRRATLGGVFRPARVSGALAREATGVSIDTRTLEPGDLIFTGTPDGVGAASRNFLKPGDTVTSTIEGIGTMVNRCVA